MSEALVIRAGDILLEGGRLSEVAVRGGVFGTRRLGRIAVTPLDLDDLETRLALGIVLHLGAPKPGAKKVKSYFRNEVEHVGPTSVPHVSRLEDYADDLRSDVANDDVIAIEDVDDPEERVASSEVEAPATFGRA